LDKRAKAEPGLTEAVGMKLFCRFSFAEIGALQKLSERAMQRKWEKARIYLRHGMRADLPI
jgi:hypothetical protein